MGIVEQSANAPEIISDSFAVQVYRELIKHYVNYELPILYARLGMARAQLKLEIMGELISMGAPCDDYSVERIIAGLPEDVLNRELAKRT